MFQIMGYKMVRPGKDRIRQCDDIQHSQAHSGIKIGSEPDFAYIMNTVGQGILVTDEEWRFEYVNPAFARIVGKPLEELIGKSMDDFLVPEDLPILARERSKRLAGEADTFEFRLRRSDGEVVYIHATGVPRKLGDRVVGFISVITDMTERKNVEGKLAEESNKFKVLYDLALNMSAEKSLEENMAFIVDKSRELLNTDTSFIALLDEKGQSIRMHTLSGICTEAFRQMCLPLGKGLYGLVMETHKGYIVDDYFKKMDIKHVVDSTIADEGLVSGMAVPVQIKDKSLGVLYAFNRRKTPFTQEDLNTLALLGNLAAVEIIRKHSSNALESQLNFLQQLIDAIPNPIFFKDTKGVYRGCNTAFESFTGLTKEIMVGKTVYEAFPKDLADIYYKADNSLFQNLGVQIYETTMVHADGTRRNVMFNKAPFFDTRGRLAGLVGVILDITERKKAEEKQKESNDYLNKIINSMGDPIFVKNRDHRFVLVNDALCNLMGHLPEEILGRTDHDFFPKDQADVFLEKDEMVFESGEENINDEKITDAQSTIRDITTKKTLYTDNAGNQFIVGMVRDISDRKQAEDALRETRNYLESLLNHANAPIIVWDTSFRITRFNHAFERLIGHKAEEVIGQRLDILFPESSREKSLGKIERTLAGEYWESVEVPILHKDGSIRIALWNSANIYADDGKTHLATMAQGTDITERKRAAEAIKESERRLADIINFLPDATLVIDREGRVIAWNRALEAMTGIKAEEILGKSDYEYALPFYGERRPILIDLVLKSRDEIEKGYTDLRRLDGTLVGGAYMPNLKGGGIFLLGSAAALYDSEGNISGAIESIRDITENKHAEEELRRAKDAAESAMRAKSEFLANMSHEIRTPMNAVIGLTGILLNSDLDPDKRECVEIIHSSGDALLAIINDILDYSKIEEGKGELESQPFNLSECIESSMDLVASKAREKNLDLACKVDDNVPENLMGDVTRLRQILVNLLSNAVKFTDAGKVSITVTSPQEDDRHEICFTVRDTGIGIPPERMNCLFQSFSQVDMSTTRKYGGTGLGLAISKRLVEMMGGKIWAESEIAIGSAFHFTIIADSAPAGRLAKGPVLQSQVYAQPDSSLRLLLAEDNVVNQKVALRMIKKIGYRADVAANGLEVLEAMARQKYDIVLMDVQMPEMDGLEAARAIRQMPLERQPKIIAVTAYALKGDREKCLDAGMDDYISKPVEMKELAEVLSKYQRYPQSCAGKNAISPIMG